MLHHIYHKAKSYSGSPLYDLLLTKEKEVYNYLIHEYNLHNVDID